MNAGEWAYKTQVNWWPASSALSDTDLLHFKFYVYPLIRKTAPLIRIVIKKSNKDIF